jgi:hypothetical protein
MKSLFILATTLILSFTARADFQFIDLSQSEVDEIFGELTTANTFTSISGAGGLGSLFGFELGLVGGQSDAGKIKELIQEAGGTYDGKLYHAGVLGRVTVPLGITGEINYMPELEADGAKLKMMGLAALINLNATVLSGWPVDIGLRAHYASMDLKFDQVISSVNTNVSLENTITGLQLLVSRNLIFAEPYAGIGVIQSKGDLSLVGNTFLASAQQSASSDQSGTQWMVGSEFKLFIIKLGVEYGKILDDSRVSGKLSFYF